MPARHRSHQDCHIILHFADRVRQSTPLQHHICDDPVFYHPMTQGKIERYHRSLKNIVKRRHPRAPLPCTLSPAGGRPSSSASRSNAVGPCAAACCLSRPRPPLDRDRQRRGQGVQLLQRVGRHGGRRRHARPEADLCAADVQHAPLSSHVLPSQPPVDPSVGPHPRRPVAAAAVDEAVQAMPRLVGLRVRASQRCWSTSAKVISTARRQLSMLRISISSPLMRALMTSKRVLTFPIGIAMAETMTSMPITLFS